MPYTVKFCPLCRHGVSESVTNGRAVMIRCHGCGAVVEVEFDPEDDPTLRGRITVLTDPHPVEAPATPREILLVDDDRGFAETLAALLHYEGFTVATECTVAAAAEHLSARKPHVLITDVRLQHENGWTLAKHAKRQYPDMGVIVVTGFTASDQDAEAEYWRLPVFLKPFDPDDLVAYIRNVA